MPYRYLEDETKADEAFLAWGRTLEELFVASSEALLGIMLKNSEKIEPTEFKTIELKADSVEFLLHNFLQEILYLKDVELVLFKALDVTVENTNGEWFLKAKVGGVPIESRKEDLLVDVKAVTFHGFSVTKGEKGWEARIMVDV